jgi:TonB family protein
VTGEVVIDLRIAKDGSVGDARIAKSVPMLDKAALKAAKQWTFEPALKDGKPVEVLVTITMDFALK